MNEMKNKFEFKTYSLFLFSVFILLVSFIEQKPTLYIIGDSTVRNEDSLGHRGWGSHISKYLDTNKISISNQAMAGRSTRTFIKEGRWDKVLSTLKKGDFVMMQFGHNEGSKPDTGRRGYRGVLRGIGEDTVQLHWKDGTTEIVHSYGWYIKKFITDVKAKGAIPIVLSMIPRNEFKDGKVQRADKDYGLWAKQVAENEGAYFIDLNAITADKYDKLGPDETKKFFPGDHTHTNPAGADVNAQSVVEGLRMQKNISLNKFLLQQ
jgi:Lysophospholipase L1 and related esterases